MITKTYLKSLKQIEVAALLDLSERRIQQLHLEGLPRNGTGRNGVYDWAEVKAWYVGYVSPSGASNDESDKARKLRAEADIAEMQAQEMAGNLLNRSEAILAWSAFLGRMKDNLLGYAGRVAPRIEDGMILAEREAVLNKEMHQVLRDVVAEVEKAAAEVER